MSPSISSSFATRIFVRALAEWFVLVGALLFSAQLRMQGPLGGPLGDQYDATPPNVFLALAVAALATNLLNQSAISTWRFFRLVLSDHHPYRRFVLTVLLACALVLITVPGISKIQLLVFALSGISIGALAIAIPFRIYIGHPRSNIKQSLGALIASRSLLSIWLRFNIESRYSQRILGVLWIVLLPISTSLVLAFAFSQFMRIDLDVPFIAFYMSAVVPYNLFSNSLLNSTNSVVGKLSIIGQVYFPREVLVLLTLGEGLVDFAFAFITMLVINVLVGVYPNSNFVYLPILFGILVAILLGLMLLASAISVKVRDIPQIIAVLLQLLFFLTPVIYPINSVPENFQMIFLLNPLAPIIQGFRDVITYGMAPNLISLGYPLVSGIVLLTIGFSVFKSFENEMADYL